MKILPTNLNRANTFKANDKKNYSTQEILNDLSDVCITVGILSSGDIFSSSTNKKTSFNSFGQVMLVIGGAIVALRVFNKLFNNEGGQDDTKSFTDNK